MYEPSHIVVIVFKSLKTLKVPVKIILILPIPIQILKTIIFLVKLRIPNFVPKTIYFLFFSLIISDSISNFIFK